MNGICEIEDTVMKREEELENAIYAFYEVVFGETDGIDFKKEVDCLLEYLSKMHPEKIIYRPLVLDDNGKIKFTIFPYEDYEVEG